MKILILASQHGDEHLGEKLYQYIEQRRPKLLQHVEYLVANPQARRKNIRFISSDMNRSYNGKSDTYEERRATKVLKYINQSGFDLVLDCHNTGVDQPPSLIVKSINSQNTPFIQSSSIDRIVVMNHSIADTALNGVCPQALSIEVHHDVSRELLDKLCDDIARYVNGAEHKSNKYVYEVNDLLGKSEMNEDEAMRLQNFELADQGFYPVLVGENSYRKFNQYLGFKAYKRYKFKV